VDAGKSTLLGVLTSQHLDNGRGLLRQSLFRHKHEIISGRTSSVGIEIMGFDVKGEQIVKATGNHGRKLTWEDIIPKSSKSITLYDLAGHEKYLKTTVFGLTACAPDYVMLIIGANAGIIGMTKEHLGLALALNIPVLIVVTKIDMCPPNILEATLKQIGKILKSPGIKKITVFVKDMDDVLLSSQNIFSDRICPVFQVSNVSGVGLDLLVKFLNLLQAYKKYDEAVTSTVDYQVTDIYSVPGVGTVVSGVCLGGKIVTGDNLLIGPNLAGQFVPCSVKSIQRKKVNTGSLLAGMSGSLALKKFKRSLMRKGMVVISKECHPQATWEFEAQILILHHSSTIAKKYQAMIHCGNVRQTARIVSIGKINNDDDRNEEDPVLRTGDHALLRFRFITSPEFIRSGAGILFREGRTKGVGRVVNVF
jgi:GTPase